MKQRHLTAIPQINAHKKKSYKHVYQLLPNPVSKHIPSVPLLMYKKLLQFHIGLERSKILHKGAK